MRIFYIHDKIHNVCMSVEGQCVCVLGLGHSVFVVASVCVCSGPRPQ